MLEVLIGLALSYTLLGAVAALIAGGVATALDLQYRHVAAHLRELLGDHQLASKLLAHPTVRSLGRTAVDIPGWVLLSALTDLTQKAILGAEPGQSGHAGDERQGFPKPRQSLGVALTPGLEETRRLEEEWLDLG